MKSTLFVIFLLACAAIFFAGCTQIAGPPTTTSATTPVTTQATPSMTVGPTPATSVPTSSPGYLPGPLPSNYAVNADVARNTVAIKPDIIVTYRGGKGINYVYSMEVVVTRSDGTVIKDTILRPKVNDVLELQGTTGTDHVQVFITLITKDPPPGPYLIFDENMRFR